MEEQVNALTFAGHCNLPDGLLAHREFLKRDGRGHWREKNRSSHGTHGKMGGVFIATLRDLHEQETEQKVDVEKSNTPLSKSTREPWLCVACRVGGVAERWHM